MKMKIAMLLMAMVLVVIVGIPVSAFTAVGLHRFAACIHKKGIATPSDAIAKCTIGDE